MKFNGITQVRMMQIPKTVTKSRYLDGRDAAAKGNEGYLRVEGLEAPQVNTVITCVILS